jgi:hypothetical protein
MFVRVLRTLVVLEDGQLDLLVLVLLDFRLETDNKRHRESESQLLFTQRHSAFDRSVSAV